MSEEDAKGLAHKASTRYTWMPNSIYVPRGIHEQFWEIVQMVATTDTTCETDMGDLECTFCNGDMDYTPPGHYVHTPDCITVKAKALMEQVNT